MKGSKTFRLLTVFAFVALLGLAACSKDENTEGDAQNTNQQMKAENSDTQKGRKILYWQAPMDATEIYDHPGKSKMGMDLVPVYEDQVSGSGTVRIDPVTVQNMGVRVAPVNKISFRRSIRAVGRIEFNEEKIYIVSPKISGWIEKLYVDFTGKQVVKGQSLLEIYSPDLVTTQQEYLLALKNREMIKNTKFSGIREGAESLLESSLQRLLYWDVPQTEIDRLTRSGKVQKTLTLNAPASGIVLHKNAVDGMFVKEGMDLYKIADISTIWIIASIYDNEAPWINEGQTAELDLPYNPGKSLYGKVSYIYPYLNEKSRTIDVRLEFPNPGYRLKPGMFANVKLNTPVIENAIVIPAEAVIRSGERNIVFVSSGEGRFEPREVSIGEEGDNGMLRIKTGLLEGENIVISAQFLMDSESRLQEAIQKMLEQKANMGSNEQIEDGSTDVQKDENSPDYQDGEMPMNHTDHDMSSMNNQENEQSDHKSHDMSKMNQKEAEELNLENQSDQNESINNSHDKHKMDHGK